MEPQKQLTMTCRVASSPSSFIRHPSSLSVPSVPSSSFILHPSSLSVGMTLIEVLLAIAILIVGLTAIFALLYSGVQSHRRAIHETEAVNLASSVLADLRADFFCGREPHSDSNDVFWQSKDVPNYEYNRLVIPLEPPRRNALIGAFNREYYARVLVRWSQQGEKKTICVETIMFRKHE